jgi:hypothetical protein
MPKPPKLKLVEPGPTGIQPPRKLGDHGMKLWSTTMREYAIEDCGGVEILAQICAALDRAETLAEQVAADGAVIQTKSGLREHPAVKAELACRAFICRNLQRLGLNLEPIKAHGRPPGGFGWKGG